MKRLLAVIVGPTAVGKTTVSIQVARHFHTEIISADARQFYHEMSIGVARPSGEHLSQIPHHFIGHLSIHQTYTAGDFERDALDRLNSLFHDHELVILTGGSGLFVKTVLHGLDSFPDTKQEVEENLAGLYQQEGIPALKRLLEMLDPEYYEEADLNNPQRLLRALAVSISSGIPYSSFRQNKEKKRDFSSVIIGLELDRKTLYQRIDDRVDVMMKAGFLQEAQGLVEFRESNALQTVGYKELFDHLDGKMSLDEAVEQIKQHTRNYAKRQMTWFRKQKNINWFNPAQLTDIINFIDSKLKNTAAAE